MCPPCSSLVQGDPAVRGHRGLRAVGDPLRHTGPSRLDVWIINYRCDDCEAEWHFHFHPSEPTKGFQAGRYGA